MGGHEDIVNRTIPGAGTGQARYLPVVDRLRIPDRHRQTQQRGLLAVHHFVRREHDPLAVRKAAAKTPVAAEPVAAIDAFGRAARHDVAGHEGVGAIGPDFLLQFFGIQPHLKAVLNQDADGPGRGETAAAERTLDLRDVAILHLQPAEAPWHGGAHQAGVDHLGNRLLGQAACGLGPRAACGQARGNLRGALDQRRAIIKSDAIKHGCQLPAWVRAARLRPRPAPP